MMGKEIRLCNGSVIRSGQAAGFSEIRGISADIMWIDDLRSSEESAFESMAEYLWQNRPRYQAPPGYVQPIRYEKTGIFVLDRLNVKPIDLSFPAYRHVGGRDGIINKTSEE